MNWRYQIGSRSEILGVAREAQKAEKTSEKCAVELRKSDL
jgi:hypothetical protein